MPNKIKAFFGLGICLVVYFFVRLQHLVALPVFADEAIYVRWSQVIKAVETLRFIPLTDGKQPLFMWLTIPFFSIFSDPLFAGRFVSVLAGTAALVGLVVIFSLILSYHHPHPNSNPFLFVLDSFCQHFPFNLIPALIYIILPFTFFFDRLALADALLSSFGIWAFLFALLQAKYLRFDLSILSGVVLGLAWVTKSPAIYFLVLYLATVFTFILFNRRFSSYALFLMATSTIISFGLYNLLRLGPQFHMIASRNLDYIWPVSEIIRHPFDPLIPHLGDTINLYGFFIGLPLFITALVGWILSFTVLKTKPNFKYLLPFLVLLAWWLLPLTANAALAKVFTARYVLFTVPPLIIILSFGIFYLIKSRLIFSLLFVFCLIFNAITIVKLSVNPYDVVLPSTETGYNTGWTSGWGIAQAASYLKDRALHANVIVGSEGYFGTLPDGLQIFTNNTPQLTVVPLGINVTDVPANMLDAKNHGDEVYLLFNRSRLKLTSDQFNKLQIIKEFQKPDHDPLLLIKI